MKKMEISLISVSILLLTAVPPGQFNEQLVWTEKGCDVSYTVGDLITVYFAPYEGEEFELWAYDAVMNETLLCEGIGDGHTYDMTVTAEPPLGPRTFMLKMPCPGDCEFCDLCDFGQCTITIEEHDPCEDHCVNRKQDCGEYGVDCGGGCPFIDSDRDGVEDCRDMCPHSRCNRVDAQGCEVDSDKDGVTDCEDECPYERGDPSHKGCPGSSSLILKVIGIMAVGGALALWRMKSKRQSG